MITISRQCVAKAVQVLAKQVVWSDGFLSQNSASEVVPIGLWLKDGKCVVAVCGGEGSIGSVMLGYSTIHSTDVVSDHNETTDMLLFDLEDGKFDAITLVD